jgi:hypothetical protein
VRAVPLQIHYQGLLTHASGVPYVSSTGVISVSVSLYQSPTATTPVWGPIEFAEVDVDNGLFSVLIDGNVPSGNLGGSPSTLDTFLDSPSGMWLSLSVNGVPMTPRQAVVAVPYAVRAGDSERVGGIEAADLLTVDDVGALVGPPGPQGAQGTPGAAGPAGPPGPAGEAHWVLQGSDISSANAGNVVIGGTSAHAKLTVAGSIGVGADGAACTAAKSGALRWNASSSKLELCVGSQWRGVVLEGPSCTTPWGATLSEGQSVTAFQAASVACQSTCQSQTRTCSGGVLSGTYSEPSCSVAACPVNQFRIDPGATLDYMVLVQVTSPVTIGGSSGMNYEQTWNNLHQICQAYNLSAPTTSGGSGAGGHWSSSVNPGRPVTSDQWNPTYPWMVGTLLDGFPGGRIWIASGEASWLSRASYQSYSVGQNLYSKSVSWESYHPQSGGNWSNIYSGSVAVGEYVMCAKKK